MKIVIISDLHLPNENKVFLALFFKFLLDYKPDIIILNGDIIDCHSLSRFEKSRSEADYLDYELKEFHKLILKLQKYCKNIVYIKGNHSERIEKFIIRKAKELEGLKQLKIENLLELEKLGVHYEPEYFKIRNFIISHGSAAGQSPAIAMLKKYHGTNIIVGHNHRSSSHTISDILGNNYTCYVTGHMALKEKMEYAKNYGWNTGFAILEFKGDHHSVENIIGKEDSFYSLTTRRVYEEK